MTYTAELLTTSIVAIGDFNPAIFSPDWLKRHGLIGEEDAQSTHDKEHSQPLLVSHQVSAFETGWFKLQVLENQFSLISKGALSPAFKDLAAGIFQLVPHTPVIAVGLNTTGEFKLRNVEDYRRLGDVLAPKDIWNELYPDETMSPGLGVLSIKIQNKDEEGKLVSKDEKRITLQPSGKFTPGVLFSYNDHHELSSKEHENKMPAEILAMVIDDEWENAWKDAVRVFDGVLTTALNK